MESSKITDYSIIYLHLLFVSLGSLFTSLLYSLKVYILIIRSKEPLELKAVMNFVIRDCDKAEENIMSQLVVVGHLV